MKPASLPRLPDRHDFDRLITAGRALAELELHRKPMRADFYRATAVAIAALLTRVRETPELRNIVAVAEPTQTVFENMAFERDGDFRAVAGERAARDAVSLAHDILARVSRRGAVS